MKTLSFEEARGMATSALLKLASEHSGVVITDDDDTRYFIGAIDELEWEARTLSKNPDFMTYIEACLSRGAREGGLSLAEARRRWNVDPL